MPSKVNMAGCPHSLCFGCPTAFDKYGFYFPLVKAGLTADSMEPLICVLAIAHAVTTSEVRMAF